MVPCLWTSVLSKLELLPYPLSYQANGAEDPAQGLAHRWKVLASVIECLKDWEISEFILEDLGILRIGVWGPLCECCKGKGVRWGWRGRSGSDYERLWAATMLGRQDSILKAHILKSSPPKKSGPQILMNSPWNCIQQCYVQTSTDAHVSGENCGITSIIASAGLVSDPTRL